MLEKNLSKVTSALVERVRKIYDNEEFIIGIISSAYDERDRQKLIDFIDAGDDVSLETVAVLAMNLGDARDEENRRLGIDPD